MIGEGIGFPDLIQLFKTVKDKNLQLDIKILDDGWVPVTKDSLKTMIQAITEGKVQNGADIRLRLHAVEHILRNSQSSKP